MKTRVELTPFDKKVMKNFAVVNPNIAFNTIELSVVHPQKRSLARWAGFDTFPCDDFCVSNLSMLLKSVDLLKQDGFDVNHGDVDKSIEISNDTNVKSSFSFRSMDPIFMKSQKTRLRAKAIDDYKTDDFVSIFDVSQKMLTQINKMSAILGYSDISFVISEGKIEIGIFDEKTKRLSNNGKIESPLDYSGEERQYQFISNQLSFVPGDYRFRFYSNKVENGVNNFVITSYLEENESKQMEEIGLDYMLMTGSKYTRSSK